MRKSDIHQSSYTPKTNPEKLKRICLVVIAIAIIIFILALTPFTFYDSFSVLKKLDRKLDGYEETYEDVKIPDEDGQQVFEGLKGLGK